MIAEPKKVLERVVVWKDITIKELANGCKKSVNNVMEALSMLGIHGDFSPRTPISDMKIIIEVVKKLGRRCEIRLKPAGPAVKIEDINETDAVKR